MFPVHGLATVRIFAAKRAAIIAVALLSLASVAPRQAWAQSPEDIKTAKTKYLEGRKLLEQGNAAGALSAFKQAHELSGQSGLLFYVAQAYERTGDLLNAQRHYQRYLDETPDADNAEEVLDTIIKLSDRIRQEYAKLVVKSTKPNHAVYIKGDKEPRCTTSEDDSSCTVTLKPGSYTAIVRGEGVPEFSQEITLVAGQSLPLEVKFKPQDSAKILVKSDVEGAILEVGPKRASLPLREPLALKPGRYPITVTHDKARYSGQVELEDEALTQIFVPLEHANGGGDFSMVRVGSYTAISLGVGLLVGGLWMGSQAKDSFNALEAQRSAGGVDQDLVTRGQSQQTAANILIGVGALSLAGGGGLLAWDLFANTKQDNPEPTPGSEDDKNSSKRQSDDKSPQEDDLL